MARVLPSGRVFGEEVRLPNITFAKPVSPLDQAEEVLTSKTAGVVTAGISRIKDEIDYANRVEAEKRRVADATIAERRAQAAVGALQEQQAARGAAMAAAEQVEAQRMAEAEQLAREAEKADVRWLESGAPEITDYSQRVVDALGRELKHRPTTGQAPFGTRGMTPEQQFLAGLAQADDPAAYYAAWQAQQGAYDPYIAASQTGARSGEALISPMATDAAAPPLPEAVAPEQMAEAQARLAAAQKAAAIPEAFVPKTMADFRFKVRDLETRAMQAGSPEEKQALVNQIRQTISNARGAVDMQPKDVMEAITGAAGKRAQKKAYDEMTTVEKEFLKQMYDASKERRAEAREGRAVSAEARAQEKHDKAMSETDRKARARARWLAGGGKTRRAALIGIGSNFLRHSGDYRAKRGVFSDEAIMAEAGGPMTADAVEQVRKERWRKITTLQDGTSVSGENAGSLIAALRAKGLNKKDESALSPGVVTLRQQESAATRRANQVADNAARAAGRARAAQAKAAAKKARTPDGLLRLRAKLKGNLAQLGEKESLTDEERLSKVGYEAELEDVLEAIGDIRAAPPAPQAETPDAPVYVGKYSGKRTR